MWCVTSLKDGFNVIDEPRNSLILANVSLKVRRAIVETRPHALDNCRLPDVLVLKSRDYAPS